MLGVVTMGEVHTTDAHSLIEELSRRHWIVTRWADGADQLSPLQRPPLLVDNLIGSDVGEVVADDSSIAVQLAAQLCLQLAHPSPKN